MTEYQFTLKFSLKNPEAKIDELVERLGEAGCTDALVGIGQPGRIGLDFTREAKSASKAVQSALADVKRAIPDAELVEAAPDFVGLTDIANLLGFSRQNMRKLAVQAKSVFPPPVHEGTPTIWHLATVLDWLKRRGNYEIEESLLEVAKTNRQFNLAKELHDLDITVDDAVYEGLRRMVGQRKISHFIENLVKPYIADTTLDEGYRAMAADKAREAEAMEWSNALANDVSDEAR